MSKRKRTANDEPETSTSAPSRRKTRSMGADALPAPTTSRTLRPRVARLASVSTSSSRALSRDASVADSRASSASLASREHVEAQNMDSLEGLGSLERYQAGGTMESDDGSSSLNVAIDEDSPALPGPANGRAGATRSAAAAPSLPVASLSSNAVGSSSSSSNTEASSSSMPMTIEQYSANWAKGDRALVETQAIIEAHPERYTGILPRVRNRQRLTPEEISPTVRLRERRGSRSPSPFTGQPQALLAEHLSPIIDLGPGRSTPSVVARRSPEPSDVLPTFGRLSTPPYLPTYSPTHQANTRSEDSQMHPFPGFYSSPAYEASASRRRAARDASGRRGGRPIDEDGVQEPNPEVYDRNGRYRATSTASSPNWALGSSSSQPVASGSSSQMQPVASSSSQPIASSSRLPPSSNARRSWFSPLDRLWRSTVPLNAVKREEESSSIEEPSITSPARPNAEASSSKLKAVAAPPNLNAEASTSASSSSAPSATLDTYTCPVCFSPPQKATLTPCGHVLCGLCLFTAIKTAGRGVYGGGVGARCPVCRAGIPGWDGRGGGVIGLQAKAIIVL